MEAPASLSPANKNQHGDGDESAESHCTSAVAKAQEDTVQKFASLLCSSNDVTSTSRSKGLMALLADSVADDSVILTLPSLDIRLTEGADGSSALPGIGEKKNLSEDGSSSSEQPIGRPAMAASVLMAVVNEDPKNDADTTDTKLTKSTSWTKSTLAYASQALAMNLSEFFSSLIDSRVKAWTLLLLRHSLSTGDVESRARLLGMLSASITVRKTETNFKTLPMPTSAEGQRKEADVILPLLFEVYLHLTIQDKATTVKLLAPGTISADFLEQKTSEGGIKRVVVRLDTGVMLNSMIDQARLIVFKAVANVTKAKLPSSQPPETTTTDAVIDEEQETSLLPSSGVSHQLAPPVPGNMARLAGFRSALSLSTAPVSDESPTLQKAQKSALRLNSVLLGKADKQNKTSQLGLRKVRSIKWNSPNQMPSLPATVSTKKQRMAENAAKLTSIKSFGRPHGGDFGSGPRNATFGEYGRVQMWGRDGRLAHHPSPMQAHGLTDNQIGLTGLVERNATFDLAKPSTSTTSNGGMKRETASALPRTATGLENWLLKTTTAAGHRNHTMR